MLRIHRIDTSKTNPEGGVRLKGELGNGTLAQTSESTVLALVANSGDTQRMEGQMQKENLRLPLSYHSYPL